MAGIGQLRELIGRFLPGQRTDAEVQVVIETDCGPRVAALIAAGYTVFPVESAASVAVPQPASCRV